VFTNDLIASLSNIIQNLQLPPIKGMETEIDKTVRRAAIAIILRVEPRRDRIIDESIDCVMHNIICLIVILFSFILIFQTRKLFSPLIRDFNQSSFLFSFSVNTIKDFHYASIRFLKR